MSKKQVAANYSALLGENSEEDTWESIYDYDLSLADNFLNWLKQCVILPQDFYDIVAVYCLLPSAVCKVTPYLFLYGKSGSGKSTIGKLASKLHGIDINSSSDTFAAIRNSLDQRKYGFYIVESPDPKQGDELARTEINTCMVWDDIDPRTFRSSPEIYKLFKYGYDRSCDKIMVSSGEAGTNLIFHCFCPKIFSSIHPFHLLEEFKELRRRLLVIPTAKVDNFENCNLTLNVDDINWREFSNLFAKYWDEKLVIIYFKIRRSLTRKRMKALDSNQQIICKDLIAAGVASGIWENVSTALDRLEAYWDWFKKELDDGKDSLVQIVEKLIQQEEVNAAAGNVPVEILPQYIKTQLNSYYDQGWLMVKPSNQDIYSAMQGQGYKLQKGLWIPKN